MIYLFLTNDLLIACTYDDISSWFAFEAGLGFLASRDDDEDKRLQAYSFDLLKQ